MINLYFMIDPVLTFMTGYKAPVPAPGQALARLGVRFRSLSAFRPVWHGPI